MIFWSGAGILALLIGDGILVLIQVLVDGLLGDGYYTGHGWPKLLALWLAAVPLWPFGRWLNRDQGQTKELIDPETGQRVQVQLGGEGHTFFSCLCSTGRLFSWSRGCLLIHLRPPGSFPLRRSSP